MKKTAITALSLIATLILFSSPAWALETKPSNPPEPDVTSKPVDQQLYIESVRYSGGNGDQVADPGEELDLYFSIRNPTDQAARTLSGTLDIKGTGVTAVRTTASWPDIPAGELAESSTPFVISIAKDAPRSSPCSGPPAVTATDQPVAIAEPAASDGVVSSDGNTGSGSAPTGQTSPGQAEPGSSGSAEPGVVEPAPPTSEASLGPEPTSPPSEDAPVGYAATVTIAGEGISTTAGFYNGLACPLAADGNGTGVAPASGNQTAIEPGTAERAVSKASSRPSNAPYVIVVVVLAVGAVIARARLTASSR